VHCIYIYALDLPNIRSCRHAGHNLENISGPQKFLLTQVYSLASPIPRQIFNKNYPVNPGTFGDKLRKTRMDAGLQIKALAAMIGVTEDTVINWELRGMMPRNIGRVKTVLSLITKETR